MNPSTEEGFIRHNRMKRVINTGALILFLIAAGVNSGCACRNDNPDQLMTPEPGQIWIQPVGSPAAPVWGHKNGIRVGLAPLPGPRGLLRIYTPYLGHKEEKMINFIALEPVPKGEKHRGFSELEMSALDGVRGKRFWSADDSLSDKPLPADSPAHGVVREINGMQTLTVFIFSEDFNNGAKVYVRLRFYENRPYEVELTAYAQKDSRELDHFILTATMGNFARLRTLYLDNDVKSSLQLWPDYRESAFAPHDFTPVDAMIKDKHGAAYFIAAPDEERPQDAEYAPGTKDHWKYYGKKGTQYWRKEVPRPGLQGLVNGRFTYWASESPIPGGISFENFELKEPFVNGATYIFGVTPLSPDEFIAKIRQE